MGRVAVMMTVDRPDAPMSSHFGKARWVMFADLESGAIEFEGNETQHGCNAVQVVVGHGCTDAIFVDIGDGALEHLQAAHICAWAAPAPISGREALRMFADGQLSPVPAKRSEKSAGRRDGHCCSHHEGSGAGCCHGQSQQNA
jgi:predicted Fe-Mo cluster-binding NifX family protein